MKMIDPAAKPLNGLADLAKTLGHAHRLALLEAIFQRESSVERLTQLSGLSITNTSQHLQQLRRAGFVQTRRDGKHVLYRIGTGPVANVLAALHDYLDFQQAEIQRVVSGNVHHSEHLEGVSIEELIARLEEGVLLLDVRSEEDYAAGHIPGAINIPTEALEQHFAELPRDQDILAYCGGRYCVLSIQAVSLLREKGFKAQRLEDGFPGWQAAGLRIEAMRR
ncbi:metalloregulator ArsR/SmtB family transcription factor [Massilia sp. BJB1822]|uniref:ArsR/SmtB family transcription factor n=1 Tax=Massilia sp. BJB1822 TaxID=2744470 RepID=UPI0015947F17|nr:metalloregulator ArsR/SmtB family transcription factor [Massilia sp. BJB1822]